MPYKYDGMLSVAEMIKATYGECLYVGDDVWWMFFLIREDLVDGLTHEFLGWLIDFLIEWRSVSDLIDKDLLESAEWKMEKNPKWNY